MPVKQINLPIFGEPRYSFLDMVKYYNDLKVGYDSVIIRYSRYGGEYLFPKMMEGQANVPVRDQKSLAMISMAFEDVLGESEALGFEFEVPIPRGFRARINATLSSWDQSEILATFSDADVYFNGPDQMSASIMELEKDEDRYGYARVLLNRRDETDLNDPANFLQAKIKRWLDKEPKLIMNRLFSLRTLLFVYPFDKEFHMLESDDFECREDAIILEFLDNFQIE